MESKDNFWVFKIRKKPWYVWILRIVWIAWLIFWAEVAIGSWKEIEQRAFIISCAVFILSLLAGLFLWFIRKKLYQKVD